LLGALAAIVSRSPSTTPADPQRDRREAEYSLALLDSLYAEAPVGLAFVDTDMRFRRVNKRFAAMSGVAAEAHIGERPEQVLGGLGVELGELYRRALAEPRPSSHELQRGTRTDPASTRHWQVSLIPVSLGGETIGVSAVLQDVTQRKQAETRAAFLSRAAELLDSSLDYRTTLQALARLAVPQMADWCSISMINEHGEIFRQAVAHRNPAKDRLAQELIGREVLAADAPAGAPAAMQALSTQFIEDFSDDLLVQSLGDRRSREIIRALGIGSSISVPLIARGRTLGAISLIGERRARFSAEDLRLAEELARRAATNIDNARLYTEHARIARTLQAGLLPQALPQIPGVELSARYRPAGELVEVGGDFYDVYLRSNGEWLLVIGDVTGKGPEAAATTALVRYTLRAAAQRHGSLPELLQDVNTAMIAQQADYCTIGLVSIRFRRSAPALATVCLGGHPSPILCGPGGEAAAVGSPGPLLGYVAHARFPESQVRLEDRATLLLYTDGLTDAAAPPALTQAQLGERVRDYSSDGLDRLLAHLESAAVAEARGRPRDDIAMLAVRPGGDSRRSRG
jgi:PAS domain S-box-containing protein